MAASHTHKSSNIIQFNKNFNQLKSFKIQEINKQQNMQAPGIYLIPGIDFSPTRAEKNFLGSLYFSKDVPITFPKSCSVVQKEHYVLPGTRETWT